MWNGRAAEDTSAGRISARFFFFYRISKQLRVNGLLGLCNLSTNTEIAFYLFKLLEDQCTVRQKEVLSH